MNIKQVSILILTALLAASCGPRQKGETCWKHLASDRPEITVFTLDEEENLIPCDTLFRGDSIKVFVDEAIKIDKQKYSCIGTGKKHLYISDRNLADDCTAVVLEKEVFTRTPASVISDTTCGKIGTLAKKGSRLTVTGYDVLDANGNVRRYKVIAEDGTEGYIFRKYTVFDKESSLLNYNAAELDPIHSKVRNPYKSGKAVGCDFYPVEKPVFKDNHMPRHCYSIYLHCGSSVLGNIDEFIALAKQTRINTFVIDIKDNERPGYKADAMKQYSPSNYSHASKSGEKMYKYAVDRLHAEGFYVVGRITCFKDSYFVKDNPSAAITDKETGEPFKHNKAFWPSAYDRRVWQFNVELAKESVRKFGFNEINFDYVRFPDRMTSVDTLVNYNNKYDETKVQAIQRFVQYACDEIHSVGAYVSIDVFGECSNIGYTTAYGQYWPALSNVADVMCPMPYPDHFPKGFYGMSKPWNHPYELLSEWGKSVVHQQKVTTTPAKVRCWVQAYHVMKYVDRDGIDYDGKNIEKEVRALFDRGLDGGYITWLASSDLERYKYISPAFCVDYTKPAPAEPAAADSTAVAE